MGKSSYTYEEPTGFHRFNSNYNTCDSNKLYINFFDGLFNRFKDAFFFSNVLQFALVALMYYNVGKGKYWKVLFYSSICGMMGSLIETGTVSFLCTENRKETPYTKVFTFLIAEIFWICNEFSIPYLNLIKMRAFSKDKTAKIISYIVLGIFPLFSICRLWIGYVRSKYGVLNSFDISNSHGIAFALMALADLICTCGILYFVKKNNQKEFNTSNINHYIKRSSYIILICVDLISILLAIICFLPYFFSFVPDSVTLPFHSVKSAFILILASDALLFKYEVNSSYMQNSSSQYNKYGTGESYSINKFHNNNNIDNSSYKSKSQNNNNNTMISVAPFNYTSSSFNDDYQPKSIIKNYTNYSGIHIPQATLFDYQIDNDNNNFYRY
ncbi:hypothetical protein H8356DRAFT_1382909 [Neocallimastix lanati (nom. inval.)]|uniref:Uncharacterized protein n=1 Tax=Neocallimastix californiae TaxID=1754190 RepID=A0A1Y1ZHT1_9FUNG|nr:hypothetical protein H8356DRAFT_1382909 [Neocallimastix sp. JGI-2020a]ORY09796.1 hypothetical protein LY90DRAFT_518818 [Neocallimastix californiae]|eukprot:ORY09796.1 hypothetical protein LY90DRAFT_518818 [Neocallimastix californiae]